MQDKQWGCFHSSDFPFQLISLRISLHYSPQLKGAFILFGTASLSGGWEEEGQNDFQTRRIHVRQRHF